MNPKLDLVLERTVDMPPELVWRAWTEPKHMVKWFTPKPWGTKSAEVDLRSGGRFNFVMLSPEGEEHRHFGCLLEVVPNRRLTWTDALLEGWRPSGKAFMTAIVELVPAGKGTLYRATAIHADEETRKKHEEMGFQTGWSAALDQLLAHARTM